MEFNPDISKEQALRLLDERITVFSRLRDLSCSQETQDAYHSAVAHAKKMLNRIYLGKAGDDLEEELSTAGGLYSWRVGESHTSSLEEESFGKRIAIAIRELNAARKDVEEFMSSAESIPTRTNNRVPFVSKSFADQDKSLNNYFEGILRALQIEFTTGEPYSKDGVQKKVDNWISQSDLLIAIVTGRKELADGQKTSPPWISREVFFAKGKEKDLIILHENGVEELAGLKGEKQLIYFDRGSIVMMQTATVTFLQALKDHNLV